MELRYMQSKSLFTIFLCFSEITKSCTNAPFSIILNHMFNLFAIKKNENKFVSLAPKFENTYLPTYLSPSAEPYF